LGCPAKIAQKIKRLASIAGNWVVEMAGKTPHIERVQCAIDFIELHLKDELDIHEIAYRVGYSASHFQRLFQALLGQSVADYIRRRRLTEALQQITHGDVRILDVALDYQFESQESFTRAFKACFGITPGECRRDGGQSLAARRINRIRIEHLNHVGKGMTMTPKIVDMAPFSVIGIEARFISILSPDKTNDVVIPKLWADFSQRSNQIPDRLEKEALGLVYCLDDQPKSHPNECLYVCGVKVSTYTQPPTGMIRLEVPGGKYAVFTHQGPADKFDHMMKYIYGSWFPKSGYEFDDRPEIEIYSGEGEQNPEPTVWDICIPIKQA